MDMKDISSQAEKYKREMMKLYGRRREDLPEANEEKAPDIVAETVIPEASEEKAPGIVAETMIPEASEEKAPGIVAETIIPEANEENAPYNVAEPVIMDINEESSDDNKVPENYDIPTDEEIFNVDEDAPDDTAWSPHSEEDREATTDIEDEYNTRYPDPDLSELDADYGETENENITPPEYISEESMGSATGYIIVNVRTGDESSAVENATVLVTAIVDGNRMILASGQTDRSGTTPKFEVPVPDLSYSQAPDSSVRPYNLFDVSVTAEGFFNARSVDVPVFAGITSIQNFNMIPVPSMMSSNSETVTYFNQEPNFNGQGEN